LSHFNARSESIDARLDLVGARLSLFSARSKSVDARLDAVDARLH